MAKPPFKGSINWRSNCADEDEAVAKSQTMGYGDIEFDGTGEGDVDDEDEGEGAAETKSKPSKAMGCKAKGANLQAQLAQLEAAHFVRFTMFPKARDLHNACKQAVKDDDEESFDDYAKRLEEFGADEIAQLPSDSEGGEKEGMEGEEGEDDEDDDDDDDEGKEKEGEEPKSMAARPHALLWAIDDGDEQSFEQYYNAISGSAPGEGVESEPEQAGEPESLQDEVVRVERDHGEKIAGNDELGGGGGGADEYRQEGCDTGAETESVSAELEDLQDTYGEKAFVNPGPEPRMTRAAKAARDHDDGDLALVKDWMDKELLSRELLSGEVGVGD
nr:hypothetical protein B0A51_06290 [Rachicladosporium sp. CCFEE 5018]